MRFVPLPIGALAFLLGVYIESNTLRGAALIACGLAIPLAFMVGGRERWAHAAARLAGTEPVLGDAIAAPEPIAMPPPAREVAAVGSMTMFMRAVPLCDTQELEIIARRRAE